MPDIFISYSTEDQQLAEFLRQHLTSEGVEVFMASVSLAPGDRWPQEILNAVRSSSWVLFLASRAACSSAWVQQELGAALITQKKLVPVVWDMSPSQLPGWVQHFQAINLAGLSLAESKAHMTAIAARIKLDKTQGLLVMGLVVAAILALGSK